MKAFFYFLLVLIISCTSTPPQNKIIGLQPLQSFPKVYSDSIASSIKKCYGFKTKILPTKPLPKGFFVNIKSARYRADSIIAWLNHQIPEGIDQIIGLTTVDISCTKKTWTGAVLEPESKYLDWGVFGFGYVGKKGCVVSNFRIKNAPQPLTIERMQKISLHEIGHNFGLPHCTNPKCFMQDAAESIKTIDRVSMHLCKECRNKLN
jgi:archaemetzincin